MQDGQFPVPYSPYTRILQWKRLNKNQNIYISKDNNIGFFLYYLDMIPLTVLLKQYKKVASLMVNRRHSKIT
jgi:hypothetical protein